MGSQIPGEPNFNKYIQYCNMKTLEENSKDRMRGKKKKKPLRNQYIKLTE